MPALARSESNTKPKSSFLVLIKQTRCFLLSYVTAWFYKLQDEVHNCWIKPDLDLFAQVIADLVIEQSIRNACWTLDLQLDCFCEKLRLELPLSQGRMPITIAVGSNIDPMVHVCVFVTRLDGIMWEHIHCCFILHPTSTLVGCHIGIQVYKAKQLSCLCVWKTGHCIILPVLSLK